MNRANILASSGLASSCRRVLPLCLAAFVPFGFACAHSPDRDRGGEAVVPRPGVHIPAGASEMATIHAGGRLCTHWIEVAGVKYNFDVECGKSTVVYVQTKDPRFRTPEGISVGQALRDAASTPDAAFKRIDDRCGVQLLSGWVARVAPVIEPRHTCEILLDEPISYFDDTTGPGADEVPSK